MVFGGCDVCTCGIGQCFGARISVHWSLWINLLIQVIFALIQYGTSWQYLLLIAVVWGPALILGLLLHESGHIGATRCQRGSYSQSMLWPLGGFNDCTVRGGKCMQEFFIALCGPMMHVPMMFLWLLVMAVSSDEGASYYGSVSFSIERLEEGGAGEWFAQLGKRSLDVNIMIFALNLLLPAYPLDCASMVAAVCGHYGLSIHQTGWALVVIGGILGGAALIIGILYIVNGSGPGVLLVMLGLYVIYSSWLMYGQVKDGSIGSHPIFKPDCYHRGQPTNLSRSPSSRKKKPATLPPASPRNMSPQRSSKNKKKVPAPTSPRSPRKSNNQQKSANGPKKSLPKRGGNREPSDIEMGQSTKKKPASLDKSPHTGSNKSTGNKKKKKKASTGGTDN